MAEQLGTMTLMFAVLLAAGGILACVAAARFDSAAVLKLARAGMTGMLALITAASVVLFIALARSDFSLAYVAGYTERALPMGYKLAAFWAGQEGSLLLWAWLLVAMSAAATVQFRAHPIREQALLVGSLTVACGFFAALMLFAANPFAPQVPVVMDGYGLNPMLQNVGMLAHPPMLFLGYAGFTIPLAILIAALGAGRRDNDWVMPMRRWLIVAWVSLTVGIVLGAQWAYVELGWGGYWAWDPVENASLLPWLTGTALLHSIMSQHQRGMMKRWNAWLVVGTFLLCIFGTYLTRSGIVQSVHAFGESLVSTFFLVFMIVTAIASTALIVWRRRLLRPEHRLERLVSKEGAFLATNVLLVLITAVTLVGTIFPVLSGLFTEEPSTVQPTFYNKVVIPFAVALLAVMAFGPLLGNGHDAVTRMKRGLLVPIAGMLITLVAALALGLRDGWALLVTAIASLAVLVMLTDFARTLRARLTNRIENPLAAGVRLLDSNHRRYGGHAVHLGMLLVMIGVAGSSLFGLKENVTVTPGQAVQVGSRSLVYESLERRREANYTAYEASVTITDAAGRATTLRPQVRFFDKTEQPNAEVALSMGLNRDVYLTLNGWEDGGQKVAIQVMVNPLVSWIWNGGIVMTLGGIYSLLPRLLPQASTRLTTHRATIDGAVPAAMGK